ADRPAVAGRRGRARPRPPGAEADRAAALRPLRELPRHRLPRQRAPGAGGLARRRGAGAPAVHLPRQVVLHARRRLAREAAHIAHGGIAMEYPQLILSPAYAPAISHEVAHQWFYRLVGDDEWSDPWVDETMTEFSAVRLGRALHGPDRLKGCAQHHRKPKPPS